MLAINGGKPVRKKVISGETCELAHNGKYETI